MFGLSKKRQRADVIGVKIDITVNLVEIDNVVSKLQAPTTNRLERDWLSENSIPYRTGVTWLTAVNGEGFFVTHRKGRFSSDTPIRLHLPKYIKKELLLTAIEGSLLIEYDSCTIADLPIGYFKKIMLGTELMSSHDPRETLRGKTFEDDYPVLYQGEEVVLQTIKTLYPNSFSLRNSVIKLDCEPVHRVSDLLENT